MSNLKKIEGGVTTPQGFTAGAVYTAIKKRENKKPDVAVLYSDLPCSCAACFTTNKFCAAPVILDREILKKGKARAVVINSGNANAATGKQGIEDARTVEREAEKLLGLGEDEVFVCSTGVIGQRLPVDKVLQGIREIIPAKLAKENGSEAAYAIMTTDTVRKECAYELQLSTGTVKIGAMAKGSGMIHPNMATMLVYVTTDAKADPADLQKMLSAAVDKSFNMCTVDGDTSTNDSIFLLANGASGVEIKTEEDKKAMADLVLAMQTIMERGEKLAAPPSAARSFLSQAMTFTPFRASSSTSGRLLTPRPMTAAVFPFMPCRYSCSVIHKYSPLNIHNIRNYTAPAVFYQRFPCTNFCFLTLPASSFTIRSASKTGGRAAKPKGLL